MMRPPLRSTLLPYTTLFRSQVSDANETLTVAEDSGASTGNVLTNASSVDGTPSVVSFTVAGVAGTQNPGDTGTVTGKGTITLGSDAHTTDTQAPCNIGCLPL